MNVYVYIHIPYCYKKCPYCSFVSYEKALSTKQEYLNALIKEIECFFNGSCDFTIKTIYLGGGTPSLLKPSEIELIFNTLRRYKVDTDCEITIEINPNDAKLSYLKQLKEIGINRVSLGVQSFLDKKLAFLQRIHNSNQSFLAVEHSLEVFKNVSIDLIYGFEEFEDFKKDLDYATSFPVTHLSAYILSIEKGTPFYKQHIVLSEENIEKQYMYLVKSLKLNNIYQYEVSNFAKKGFESKHNLAYWMGFNYVGFGLSSSSFIDGIRYKNTNSLNEYISKIYEGKSAVTKKEKLSSQKRIKEAFVLGMRMRKGVNIKQFNQLYNCDIERIYEKQLSKHYDLKTLRKSNYSIKISNTKKTLISNYILSDFI